MPEEITHAAIYARSAAPQELNNATAIIYQIHAAKEYAARAGYEVSEELTYQEVAGGATLDRVALTRLRRDAKERKFTVVIVLDLNRLSRRYADALKILAELQESGVHVETVHGAIYGNARGKLEAEDQEAWRMVSDFTQRKR